MRLFLFLMLAFIYLFSCGGDCVSCHSGLDYSDGNHNVMVNCKNCHDNNKPGALSVPSSCGQDCFACHSLNKINSVKNIYHSSLMNCIECHKSIKASVLKEKMDRSKSLYEYLSK